MKLVTVEDGRKRA